jgi:hypothetical protein
MSKMGKALGWVVGILVILLVVIGIASAFIDDPLRAYAEREFNRRLEGYTLHIGALHFHPIGLSIDLEHARLVQNEHPDPPVAGIPKWHASLHWGALLRGQVVSDHAIDRPVLHVTRPQAKKEMKDLESVVEEKGWQEAVLALYPLEINLLTIADADITYLDNPKAQPLHITHLNVRAENIRNVKSEEGIYPSRIHLDAIVFDTGRMKIDGSADFLSEPEMGLKADVVLEDISLAELLPLTGRVNLQLRQGAISARGRAEYSPYVKVVELKDLRLESVQLDYVHAVETKESEQQVAAETAEAAEKVSNDPEWLLRVERGKILNSEFGFVNTAVRPPYRVFLTDTNIGLANFSNQLSEGTAHIKVTGKFMGSGPTQVSGTFRPETESPDFDLNIRMVRTKMQSFNDVLRAYGDFDVVKGAFSVFTELKVKDGTIKGYVKPLFKNVEVYDPDQDRDKGLLQTVFEGVISGVTDLLKNTPRDEVATKVDVSGPVKHPKASTWQIVVNLIQNAFFKAILPGFEKEAKNA